jgi:hypothetical protein
MLLPLIPVTNAISPPDTTSPVLIDIAQLDAELEIQIPFPTMIPVTEASGNVVAAAVTALVNVVGLVPEAGTLNRKFGPTVAASCVTLILTAVSVGDACTVQV